jgi:FMN phosphatase YigB (HAD superfamily)
MQIIEHSNIWEFDIDNTLVMHDSAAYPRLRKIFIKSPYTGVESEYAVNEGNVLILKEKRARGCFVVARSQRGYAWTTAVVDALGLRPYIHLVIEKPSGYVDDKDAGDFYPKRVYIKPDEVYK